MRADCLILVIPNALSTVTISADQIGVKFKKTPKAIPAKAVCASVSPIIENLFSTIKIPMVGMVNAIIIPANMAL